MKKIVALVLAVMLCVGMTVHADTVRDFTLQHEMAKQLYALGLFYGTENGFELERSMTRAEAVVMLVRALGKAEAAQAMGKTHPFTDVPSWADGYISYAYENKLTNGVSETEFGASDEVLGQMYLTFILRALGYTDEDFFWDVPYPLASYIGITPPDAQFNGFLRADAVSVTTAALFVNCKDTKKTLAEKLIAESAFSVEEFETAYPSDPHLGYRTLDALMQKTISEKYNTGKMIDNERYKIPLHFIESIREENGQVQVCVLEMISEFYIREGNESGGGGYSSSAMVYVFDAQTMEFLSSDHGVRDDSWISRIAPEYKTAPGYYWDHAFTLCQKLFAADIESGKAAWKAPTYEERMASFTKENYRGIYQTYETDFCTVVESYVGGTPHGTYASIGIVYKPGAEMGEGTYVGLPMPEENGWGLTRRPDTVTVSEDGKTLVYTYTYTQKAEIVDMNRVLHEKGTYIYTVDLITGEKACEIVDNVENIE